MLNLNEKIASRTIRVFLSSTFRDMGVERSHLINTVFPHLHALARERGVELTEVDLRWGIPEEESKSGMVVRLCLKEIDDCRKASDELPFFIGLLGGRYGWMPKADELTGDPNLLDDFPKVERYLADGLSVTEMEMRHAVLEKAADFPEVLEQSYFFFRDPAYTEELKRQEPDVAFTDVDDPKLKPEEKARAAHLLPELRESIRTMLGARESAEYRNAQDLGTQVTRAFERYLDVHFPAPAKESSVDLEPGKAELRKLEEERRNQALFAQTRLAVHVGGEKYFAAIDALLADHRPVLVTGGVGSGKTALLANYIARWQGKPEDNKNVPAVLYHFCGGTSDSDRLDTLLRRLVAELQVYAGHEIKLPVEPNELHTAMLTALASVPISKPILLVVDALDQLDNVGDLRWLPPQLLPHVSLVMSVKSPTGNIEHELVGKLAERGFARVGVEPLNESERQEIIQRTLALYGKKVSPELCQRVAADKESENPLVLRTLIEEMRLIGAHEKLESTIADYIKTDSPEAFFDKVLERIGRDFEGGAEVMALIGASHAGLTEREILELMNPNDDEFTKFPVLRWSALHEVLRPHFKEQNGCLIWFHDLVRRAVESRYAANIGVDRQRLAEFFLEEQRMLTSHALREWPWHLRLLGERERMEGLFRQGKVCVALLKENAGETHAHWLWLAEGQASSGDWIASSAKDWAEEDGENYGNLGDLSNYLITWVGRPGEATILAERCMELCLRQFGPNALLSIAAKNDLARSYNVLNRNEEALKLQEEVLEQFTRLFGPDVKYTVKAKGNLAAYYLSLNRHQDALRLGEEVLEQCTRLFGPDAEDTIKAKMNIAGSYAGLNRHQDALRLGEEVLEQCTRLFGPDAEDTINAKMNIAVTCALMSYHEEALKLNEEVLEQRTRLLGPDALGTIDAKHALAFSYAFSNRDEEALKLQEEVLELRTRLLGPDAKDTINAKRGLACSYRSLNRHQDVLRLGEEVLEQCTRLFGPDAEYTIKAKMDLALTRNFMSHHEEALKLQEEALEQRTRLLGPDALDTIETKQNLAASLGELKRYEEALTLYKEVLEQRTRLLGPDALETIETKQNLASIYDSLNCHQKILDLITCLFSPNESGSTEKCNDSANQASAPPVPTPLEHLRSNIPQAALEQLFPQIFPQGDSWMDPDVPWQTLANYATALLLLGRVPEAREILARIHEPHPYVNRLRQSVAEWEKTQTIGNRVGKLFGGRGPQAYRFPEGLEPGVEG